MENNEKEALISENVLSNQKQTIKEQNAYKGPVGGDKTHIYDDVTSEKKKVCAPFVSFL